MENSKDVKGSVEKGDSTCKMIAQEVVTLESILQKSIRVVELCLNEESISKELLEDINDILFRYPGECRLFFKVKTSQSEELLISSHNRFNVLPCQEMISAIEALGIHVVRE